MQRLVYSLVVLSTVPAVFGSAGPAFPLTLLFQNSLNFTQNALSHPGLILASSHASLVEAQAICGSLSESIADFSSLSPDVTSDFQNLLDYQVHIGTFGSEQLLWVKQSNPATCEAVRANDLAIIRTSCTATLPVLCTQSAPYSNSELQDASPRFQSSVNSQGRTFVGSVYQWSLVLLCVPIFITDTAISLLSGSSASPMVRMDSSLYHAPHPLRSQPACPLGIFYSLFWTSEDI